MKRKNILVPTNFSEPAFKALLHAATMAEQLNATIHLVHVTNYHTASFIKSPEFQQLLPSGFNTFWETKQTQLDTTKRWLLEKYNVSIETMLLEGSIYEQIKQYLKQTDIDVVILSTQHANSFWKKLFGSTTHTLQKSLPVPVLTILETEGQPFEWSDVVIPVTDFVPEARINTIAAFAERFRFTIHLVGIRTLNKAGRPLHILLRSLQAIKTRYNAKVICRELQGKQIHSAAMQYANEIHANALMENNKPQKIQSGLWQWMADYFSPAEYPYPLWG